jgi:hypothetical protein
VKVAITNGWLVFDNQLGEYECNVCQKHAQGRVRLNTVAQYAKGYDYVMGGSPERVTFVWSMGDPAPWRISGDHQPMLDDYFGGQHAG